jgi:uncharacterized protein YbcV (DUF1398 family)
MNTEAMRKALEGSEAGKLPFPEVVGILSEAGVESYCADLVRGEDVFYMPTGETHAETMRLPETSIPDELSLDSLVQAIRAVQADQIRYPEFLRRAMAAGTAAYRVFITGRRVVYFGRKGEFHVENFPGTKWSANSRRSETTSHRRVMTTFARPAFAPARALCYNLKTSWGRSSVG